jgi:hypothetical protein
MDGEKVMGSQRTGCGETGWRGEAGSGNGPSGSEGVSGDEGTGSDGVSGWGLTVCLLGFAEGCSVCRREGESE